MVINVLKHRAISLWLNNLSFRVLDGRDIVFVLSFICLLRHHQRDSSQLRFEDDRQASLSTLCLTSSSAIPTRTVMPMTVAFRATRAWHEFAVNLSYEPNWWKRRWWHTFKKINFRSAQFDHGTIQNFVFVFRQLHLNSQLWPNDDDDESTCTCYVNIWLMGTWNYSKNPCFRKIMLLKSILDKNKRIIFLLESVG